MRIEYTNGVIYIFNDGDDTPWLAQPSWPDLTLWADENEARAWAQVQVDYVLDNTKPRPANGPNEQ